MLKLTKKSGKTDTQKAKTPFKNDSQLVNKKLIQKNLHSLKKRQGSL